METKKFNCKMEEVPVIGSFILESLENNITDFQDFASDYTQEKVTAIRTKRNYCLDLEKSNSVTQQLKSATGTLLEKEKELRPSLNKLEGYVKRASNELDITPESFGIATVRTAISKGNDEGVITEMKNVLKHATRNQPALVSKGMKPEFLTELSAAVAEIDTLNNLQNSLINKQIATTSANVKDYNELWDMITKVCEDARAIYKGVDEVKLKQFTIAALIKRVNAEGSTKKEVTKE
jgi:hypothetical protein